MGDAFLQCAGFTEDRVVRDWNQGILWLQNPAIMLGRSAPNGSWTWLPGVYHYVRRPELDAACDNF
jgi:hypothetical protein